ncbi:MAG: hypothetical protein EHM24_32030 [Acidobacteria bacterium]|nr:MAG: hypothetical protein EHM24_32030 [Acidobacteriota bacterium]
MKKSWKHDLWVEVHVDRDGQWRASVPDRPALCCNGGTMESAVAGLYALYRRSRSQKTVRRRK